MASRASIARWSAVALVGLAVGCGTGRNSPPLFGWMGRDSSRETRKVSRRNPLKPKVEQVAASETTDASGETRDAETETVVSSDYPPDANPESVALLERDLKDASPQERREFAGLASLAPDLVAGILRNRRLALERANHTTANERLASATEEDGIGHGAIRPIGAESRTEFGDDLRVPGGSGLGAADPWGRSNPAQLEPHLQPTDTQPGTGRRSGGFDEPPGATFGHSTSYGPGPYPHRMATNASRPENGLPGRTSDGHVPPAAMLDTPGFSDGMSRNREGTTSGEAAGGLRIDPRIALEGMPLPDPDTDDWEVAIQRLIARAENQVATARPGTTDAERNEYIRRHVHLRLLYLMAGQQNRAIVAIPGIEPADQEFWMQTLWAMDNYFDHTGMPSRQDRIGQTVAQMRTAIRKLQEEARLELRNLSFCQRIDSYGNYERFERDEFGPGQPVLLYAEVANFTSEPTADGQYRTMLKSTIEIYKAGPNGDLVETLTFPATEDLCSNYRQDYFHSYEFTVPARASLGPHVLKLTVEDQLSRKLATYSVNFTVK